MFRRRVASSELSGVVGGRCRRRGNYIIRYLRMEVGTCRHSHRRRIYGVRVVDVNADESVAVCRDSSSLLRLLYCLFHSFARYGRRFSLVNEPRR